MGQAACGLGAWTALVLCEEAWVRHVDPSSSRLDPSSDRFTVLSSEDTLSASRWWEPGVTGWLLH